MDPLLVSFGFGWVFEVEINGAPGRASIPILDPDQAQTFNNPIGKTFLYRMQILIVVVNLVYLKFRQRKNS